MSRAYASDANAKGQCDRCGHIYRLNELKYQTVNRQVTRLRVCDSCMDIDHEQLRLGEVDANDPQKLRDPRPFKSYDVET